MSDRLLHAERTRPVAQPAPVVQRKDPGQAAKTAGSAALARFEEKTAAKPKVCFPVLMEATVWHFIAL